MVSNGVTDLSGNTLTNTSFSFTTATPDWGNVGDAGFSAGEVLYTSLAINSNDTPYVAYLDGGNSYKASAMKFTSQ